MRIIKSSINWYLGLRNNPILEIYTDSDIPEFKYKVKNIEGGILYFAENDGFVSFFLETSDERGFSGRIFTLQMENGTEKKLKGPWSTRPGVVNNYFEPHCIGCNISFKGHIINTFLCVTIETALEAIKKIEGVKLQLEDGRFGDRVYNIVNSDAKSKCYLCKGFCIDGEKNPCRRCS